MKRIFYVLPVVMLLFILMPQTLNYAQSQKPIEVYINNEKLVLDEEPILSNGRLLLPLTSILNHMNILVDWNETTRQIIIKDDHSELLLEIDQLYFLRNGEVLPLDVPAKITDGRTWVPIGLITKALGHDVKWDKSSRSVTITLLPFSASEQKQLPIIGTEEALKALLSYNNKLYNYFYQIVDDFPIPSELPLAEMDLAPNMSSDKIESHHSTTNVQTIGVDEGDRIKTDGVNIYTLNENQVFIVSSNPNTIKVHSKIDLTGEGGYATDLYIKDNKLIVIGQAWSMMLSKSVVWQNETATFVRIYDVANPALPTLIKSLNFEGNYATSRLIDSYLYLVINKPIHYWYNDNFMAPSFVDLIKEEVYSTSFDNVSYFPDYVDPNYLITVGIDLYTDNIDYKTYLGSAQTVYASNNNLYISISDFDYLPTGPALAPQYNTSTTLYKFALSNGIVTYTDKGSIKGTVLNQYSIDEYNDHLRIATTTGNMWDPENLSKNHVIILNSALKTVGELNDLAPGERIYSARFAGNRIYLVTFRQVDPFFVIDASIPSAPVMLGELKIPGFSTYMHPLDDNHILGFGADVIDSDGFQTIGGLKITLFDVTNPIAPVASKTEVIGIQGTYSEIQNNPKSLLISLPKGLMGFPISVASQTPYAYAFSGAYVYSITTNDFIYKGNITHQSGKDTSFDWRYDINRLVYIGEDLFSISNGKIQVHSILTMQKKVELLLE